MKNFYRKNSRQARGFIKAKFLLVVLLTIMVGAAIFYKQRNDSLTRSRQLQTERVIQAELGLRKDVQLALAEVRVFLKLEDIKQASKSLRRASILDVDAEFARQVYELNVQITQLDQTIVKRRELKKLASLISTALKSQQLKQADCLLLQYLEMGPEDDTYTALKDQHDRLILRIQQIENSTQGFEAALAAWDTVAATDCFKQLQEFAVEAEVIDGILKKLEELKRTNLMVASVSQRIEQADTGQYSAKLLQEVDLQISNLGQHPKLLIIRKKLLSQPQTIRVPAEVASLDEAYELLINGGTVELGEGVFYTELEFNKSVVIKGAGVGVTILESRTTNGAGLHFSHPNKDSKVSHLTLRGFPNEAGGYPLLLLSGGRLDLSYVEISKSANHGMAVTSGIVKIQHCQFFSNRWDGLAVFGASSVVSVQNSSFHENADHGIDVWGGAKAHLASSQVSKNSKSGIVATGAQSLIRLTDVSSNANRECGIYLSLAASLTAERVSACNNRFSGLVAQGVHLLQWTDGDASSNGEFGYIIDRPSAGKFQNKFAGKENEIGLVSQKRLN